MEKTIKQLSIEAIELFITKLDASKDGFKWNTWHNYKGVQLYISEESGDISKGLVEIKMSGIGYSPTYNRLEVTQDEFDDSTDVGFSLFSWIHSLTARLNEGEESDTPLPKIQEFMIKPGETKIVETIKEIEKIIEKDPEFNHDQVVEWRTKSGLFDNMVGGNKAVHLEKEEVRF